MSKTCDQCEGIGWIGRTLCSKCEGSGILGDCYYNAGILFQTCHRVGNTSPLGNFYFEIPMDKLFIVHGRPTLSRHPFTKYGHAWLEVGGSFVFDAETFRLFPMCVYYSHGKIDAKECFKYSFDTFRKNILTFGHWGPWEGPEACPAV